MLFPVIYGGRKTVHVPKKEGRNRCGLTKNVVSELSRSSESKTMKQTRVKVLEIGKHDFTHSGIDECQKRNL